MFHNRKWRIIKNANDNDNTLIIMQKILYTLGAIIFYIYSYSQTYLPNSDILIEEGNYHSNNYTQTAHNKANASRQCLEYRLIMGEGSNYYLPPGEEYLHSWQNKVIRLMTNDNFGKENYLSVGWRHIISTTPPKLQVGFYAHRDHTNSNDKRIFHPLKSVVWPPAVFYVQLAFTRELLYVNIDETAMLSIRDSEDWSDNDDIETKTKWAWFGDPWYESNDYQAPTDIFLYGEDFILDRQTFWSNSDFTKADDNLYIVHTRLKCDFPYRTFISDNIEVSKNCLSTMDSNNYTNEEPYFTLSNMGSFCIIETGGSQVNFFANTIIIHANTYIEAGTPVYFGPNNLKNEVLYHNIDSSYFYNKFYVEKTIDTIPQEMIIVDDSIIFENCNTISPNPCSDYFYINSNDREVESFQLFDINGNIVLSENNLSRNEIEVDISDLPIGLYVYKIFFKDDDVEQGKIIKE